MRSGSLVRRFPERVALQAKAEPPSFGALVSHSWYQRTLGRPNNETKPTASRCGLHLGLIDQAKMKPLGQAVQTLRVDEGLIDRTHDRLHLCGRQFVYRMLGGLGVGGAFCCSRIVESNHTVLYLKVRTNPNSPLTY